GRGWLVEVSGGQGRAKIGPQNVPQTGHALRGLGCTGPPDGRKLPGSILGEGRGPVASPVFKTALSRLCGMEGSIPSLLRHPSWERSARGDGAKTDPGLVELVDVILVEAACSSEAIELGDGNARRFEHAPLRPYA